MEEQAGLKRAHRSWRWARLLLPDRKREATDSEYLGPCGDSPGRQTGAFLETSTAWESSHHLAGTRACELGACVSTALWTPLAAGQDPRSHSNSCFFWFIGTSAARLRAASLCWHLAPRRQRGQWGQSTRRKPAEQLSLSVSPSLPPTSLCLSFL